MRPIGNHHGIGAPLCQQGVGADEFIRYPEDRLVLLFNEGAGTTVRDLSGNGNDGTFGAGAAAPTWERGRVHFDGVDDYIDCGNGANLNITEALTIIGYGYNEGDLEYEHVASKRDGNAEVQYGLMKTNANEFLFEYGDAGGKWQGVTGDSFPISKTGFYAVTVNGQAYKFYTNGGQSAGSGTLLNAIPSLSSVGVYIGSFGTTLTENWHGLVSFSRINATAFSAPQLLAEYLWNKWRN